MFATYETTRAAPVRLVGMPYGHALALPQFLGSGFFRDPGPDEGPIDEDAMAQERWEDDGGPCLPQEDC